MTRKDQPMVTETPVNTAATLDLKTSRRAEALATRLEQGARALAAFAADLSDAEWSMPLPKDGRKIGVIVHHVATMYPLEIQLAQVLARGEAITGVTWDVVHGINATHASEFDRV